MASRFRRSHRPPVDLDITPFLNLMVVLIPFLLITAVFNQVSILEMNLPEQKAEQLNADEKPPEFQLEITIRQNEIQVSDKPGRILKTFPMSLDDGHDLEGLSLLLQQIKARIPDETAATLLLDPDVTYEHLIQIMDTVRIYEVRNGSKNIPYQLFPDIALGDAPTQAGKQ